MTDREAYEFIIKHYTPGQPPIVAPYFGAYRFLVDSGQVQPIKKYLFRRSLDPPQTYRSVVINYLENICHTKK